MLDAGWNGTGRAAFWSSALTAGCDRPESRMTESGAEGLILAVLEGETVENTRGINI